MAFKNSVLLAPFLGANNDTSFSDVSAAQLGSFAAGGTAVLSTDQPNLYATSGKFANITGNYFSLAHNGEIEILDGDFTVAGWVYLNSTPATFFGALMIGNVGSNSNRIQVGFTSSRVLDFYVDAGSGSLGTFGGGTGTLSLSTWHHVAITRNSGTSYTFLDGTLLGSSSNTSTFPRAKNMPTVYLGACRAFSAQRNLDGYLDDWFVLAGEALWTASFTPPGPQAHRYAGTVTDGAATGLARTVRIHERASGVLVAETTSDGSGNFETIGANVETYGVALAQAASSENADVLDQVAAT